MTALEGAPDPILGSPGQKIVPGDVRFRGARIVPIKAFPQIDAGDAIHGGQSKCFETPLVWEGDGMINQMSVKLVPINAKVGGRTYSFRPGGIVPLW